jgi:hypothetical protein
LADGGHWPGIESIGAATGFAAVDVKISFAWQAYTWRSLSTARRDLAGSGRAGPQESCAAGGPAIQF